VKQRGKRSAAALAVVPVVLMQRPKPPKRLGPEEAALWRECTESKAADFFDLASQPLLEQYCQMVCLSRGLAADLAVVQRHDVVTRAKLLDAFDKATKSALAHARALRISQQTRVSKNATAQHSSGPAVSVKRPWEV
jgi:hypothetical protein